VTSGLFDLAGRVALITGGAGHLGGEFAKVLGGAGAGVALMDIDGERLGARARELADAGIATVAVTGSVASDSDVERCIATTRERFGCLDILVNNAATKTPSFFSTTEDLPRSDWDAILEADLGGMFVCAKAALPLLRASGRGVIVNVASIYGLVSPDPRIYEGSPIQTPPAYAAAKGGVISLTRYLAVYHAKDGVRCNAVTPGGVLAGQSPEFVRRYSDRVPLARMAEAREIAAAVLFLVSDASSYVTGHNLVVDGGLTAW
jgi:NAD(P)-dependent dehydrogenase (short-subunit alcohol dehydrogenase family)